MVRMHSVTASSVKGEEEDKMNKTRLVVVVVVTLLLIGLLGNAALAASSTWSKDCYGKAVMEAVGPNHVKIRCEGVSVLSTTKPIKKSVGEIGYPAPPTYPSGGICNPWNWHTNCVTVTPNLTPQPTSTIRPRPSPAPTMEVP